MYDRNVAHEFVCYQKSKNKHEKFQHAEIGVKNHGTNDGKRAKTIVLVNFFPEGVTNKTRVPPRNVMTNKLIWNIRKLNKRVLLPNKNNWYKKPQQN